MGSASSGFTVSHPAKFSEALSAFVCRLSLGCRVRIAVNENGSSRIFAGDFSRRGQRDGLRHLGAAGQAGGEPVAVAARTDQGSIQTVTKGDNDMRTRPQRNHMRTSVLTIISVESLLK